ncbi:MAG: hypothetical protein U9N84_13810 [Actinomycetota bacterium]|nr:hypothetical protein [Actinomycetota bacterium]
MATVSRPGSKRVRLRHRLGEAIYALFFAFAPSTIPDWRADPDFRSVAVLPVGEPMASFDSPAAR